MPEHEQPKPQPKRVRKVNRGKFPFAIVRNVETDNQIGEEYVFSQKLNVLNDATVNRS